MTALLHERAGRPGPLRRSWADLDRPDRVLLALVVAVVVVKIVTYGSVAGAGVVGDEAYYVDAGKALSNLVRDLAGWAFGGSGPDGAELSRNVVGSGWFMPGMSVVLAPLFLVVPDAPTELVRGYLGVFSTLLLLVAMLAVCRTLGRRAAAAVLVFPGLVPTYALFGLASWGDQAAGLVLVLVLCRLLVMLREIRSGADVGWRSGVALGLLSIVAVYLRSSVAVLVVAVFGGALLVALSSVVGRRRRLRVLGVFVAAGVAFLALLAPWSVAASHALGGRVVTTTSVPTALANTFGDQDLVCLGPCDPGSTIWFSPLRYSREVARATGTSEMDAAQEMSHFARTEVTPTSYARDVAFNAGRYFGNPAYFSRFVSWSGAPYDVGVVATVLTDAMFFPAVLIGLLLLLMVVRGPVEAQVQSLLLKLTVVALIVQPFVHIAGSRYWTTLAPFLGLAAVLLWQERRRRRCGDEANGDRWLTLAQRGLAGFVVLVLLGVGILAI